MKHATDSIMTEGFIKTIFHSKTNPLTLGILHKSNYINHKIYEVTITGSWKEINVTIVFEKFVVFLKISKVMVPYKLKF